MPTPEVQSALDKLREASSIDRNRAGAYAALLFAMKAPIPLETKQDLIRNALSVFEQTLVLDCLGDFVSDIVDVFEERGSAGVMKLSMSVIERLEELSMARSANAQILVNILEHAGTLIKSN